MLHEVDLGVSSKIVDKGDNKALAFKAYNRIRAGNVRINKIEFKSPRLDIPSIRSFLTLSLKVGLIRIFDSR